MTKYDVDDWPVAEWILISAIRELERDHGAMVLVVAETLGVDMESVDNVFQSLSKHVSPDKP